MTWIGYPNTTGLEAIRYRLTDARADPPGSAQPFTEELVRLPDAFLCYTPPLEASARAAPRALGRWSARVGGGRDGAGRAGPGRAGLGRARLAVWDGAEPESGGEKSLCVGGSRALPRACAPA